MISGLATITSGTAADGVIGMRVTKVTVAECTFVVTVSAATATAGGIASASTWAFETLQMKLVSDLSKGVYNILLPGQTYKTSKLPMFSICVHG